MTVYESLRTAITMFLAYISLLRQNIGFGPDLDIAYDSFKRKFDRLSLRLIWMITQTVITVGIYLRSPRPA